MSKTLHLRGLLVTGASALALTSVAAPVAAQTAGGSVIQELVVTAQRREEGLQTVPVAVSAFSEESLRTQRLDGGQNLLQAIPNVNFSRGNFGPFNFSVRGIGTKVVGGSGEAGVSFHENGSPQTSNRLADAEFYDVDRIEVLRGPQGTLYGRNATGGVVNVITTKPGEDFGGYVGGEYGNYNSVRLRGALNVPLNDMMAVRLAGFYLNRDGFGTNTATGHDTDDRNISSTRLSFRLRPNDALDVNAIWEHFNEKDSRSRIGKQLCITDPGPSSLGPVPVSTANQGYLSQGCLPGSRYQPAAYGAPHSVATLGGLLGQASGLAQGNLNAGKVQSRNLYDIESVREPIYQGQQDFFQIDARLNISDTLTFNSLTSVNYNDGYSYQDYNRTIPTRPFTPAGALAAIFPGGFVDDPQVGRSNLLRQFDMTTLDTKEFTQEFRLSSNTGGAFDFSAGAIHIKYLSTTDYYVFSNGLTAYAQLQDILAGQPGRFPFYVDPSLPPNDGEGRNYYDSRTTNRITSNAVFGEIYWRPTETLSVTGGLRLTEDKKRNIPYPVVLLAQPTRVAPPPASGVIPNPNFNGGRGYPPPPVLRRKDNATTGRLSLEWSPDLSFSEQSMFYATYSRGYKGGGFNTPCDNQSPGCGAVPQTFAPEFVNAYEIGSKNVLAGGRVVLNATAFYYDYKDYQISGIINKSAVNTNVDAKIKGVELESVWQPVRNLRFNLNAGWLDTEIQGGSQVDTQDRTQGNPALAVIKAQDGANCVVSRAGLAQLVAINQGLPGTPNVPGVTGSPTALLGACNGLFSAFGLYNYTGMNVTTAPIFVNGAPGPNTTVQVGQGVAVALDGKELPNSPKWTLNLGAQYTFEFGSDWQAILRADYYRQDDSYARIFNSTTDALKGYKNVNATLTVTNSALDMDLQVFVKNLTDESPITDLYLTDDSSGLFTNTFTMDPRTYGVALTKRF